MKGNRGNSLGRNQIVSSLDLGRPGTYLLALRLPEARAVEVGRLGQVNLSAGHYAYVGSAFGSGGLGARLRHHLGRSERPHWHIDYLRRAADLAQIWASFAAERREHAWAQLLCQCAEAAPAAKGFGSSDCNCHTHLFRWAAAPSISVFRHLVRTGFPDGAKVHPVAPDLLRQRRRP